MSPPSDATSGDELERLALEKLQRVLGKERGQKLFDRVVAEHRLTLHEPNDLLRLAEILGAMGGIEAAVGAMIGVTAVIRGASSRS